MSISVESEASQFWDSEAHNNLQRILQSCPKLAEVGDSHEYVNTISELVNFLDSLLDAALSDPDNENKENDAFEALLEIHRYICSPSIDQTFSLIQQNNDAREKLRALLGLYVLQCLIFIFVDLIQREMRAAICSCTSVVKNVQQINNKAHPYISFWAPSVFELVELVLKPPQGGSPSLPEQRDAERQNTLESCGGAVYIRSTMNGCFRCGCDLNLLEMVLCLCIELVEEKLKQVK